MALPERKELSVLTNKDGRTKEIYIFNPRNFTIGSLREIVRYQVFNRKPRQILVRTLENDVIGEAAPISPTSLQEVKKYSPEKRREFLNTAAVTMHAAATVIIREAE